MNIKLTILGCYAATPRTMTNPTSQVLEIKNHMFLIDCGEGTQVQLRRNKIKFSRIDHIFISHLHGDHFFGLPGLVSTFRLLGREKDLHIYGPKGIKEAITLFMKLGDSWTNYRIIFHELTSRESEIILDDPQVSVETIPLKHRVYTNGFLFREKRAERKLNIDAVAKLKIDKAHFRNIKKGRDVVLEDGTLIPNKAVSLDPPPPKSYAYCSDTGYHPDMVGQIQKVDALYHEATFLESEARLAPKTMHCTARQAASIARAAEVGTLILGHYSTRYRSIELFGQEAQEIFPDTQLADDGKTFAF